MKQNKLFKATLKNGKGHIWVSSKDKVEGVEALLTSELVTSYTEEVESLSEKEHLKPSYIKVMKSRGDDVSEIKVRSGVVIYDEDSKKWKIKEWKP